MSSKNVAHDSKDKSKQTTHHTRTLFMAAAVLLVLGFGAVLVGIQSRNVSVATDSTSEAAVYTDALALAYVQPYLAANTGVMTAFGDALELQYAQPYLEAEAAGATMTFNDALALEYARPYLDMQAANDTTTSYSNSLAFAYAFPWLVPQSAVVTYGDALAMEYARPWLNTEPTANCNGRLDEMYACQNGR